MNGDFEWDNNKAATNLKKHGVSFEAASRIFDDAFALDRLDMSMEYGEDRFAITGLVNGIVLTAIYTEQDGRIRLISARRATRHEEVEYYDSQAQE